MNSLRTHSLVLRRTNYGEADRIVQLITPEGKFGVMAKSVRKEKSKLAGGIELLVLADVTIQQGKGDLGVLTSARVVKFYGEVLKDYDALKFVYEAQKTIARAAEQITSPELFEVLRGVLEALDTGSDLDMVRAWVYLRHARVLGEELNLETDTSGAKLARNTRYFYDHGDQALARHDDGNITCDHIKLLRLMTYNDIAIIKKIAGAVELLPECLHLAKIVAGI
jgi:DNA repair protein RecO (recombination protein O)